MKTRNTNKGIARRVLLMLALMLTLLALTGCDKKLNVTQDMDVEFSGLNTAGTAKVTFDNSEGCYGYLYDLLLSGDEGDDTWSSLTRLMALEEAVTYEVSPSEGLSNGDKVTVTVTVDKDALKELGYTAKSTKKTFKVTGLQEPIMVDAFEGFNLTFTGTTGYGRTEFEYSREIDGATVYYSADSSYNLTNGDTVTISARVSPADTYLLTEESREFTVSGLSDPIVVDAFKDLEVTFSGTAPWASASCPWSAEVDGAHVYYSFDKSSGLSNGDVITVTANLGDDETYDLAQTTKEYTVEGVDTYVSDPAQITQALWDTMKAETQEKWENEQYSWSSQNCTAEDLTYVGYEFWYRDDRTLFGSQNVCYIVYTATLTDSTTEETFPYYYYCYFNNITVQADGTCAYGSFAAQVNTVHHNDKYYYYYGYETLQGVKDAILSMVDTDGHQYTTLPD